MNREQSLKCKAIFAHYGLDSQLRILQEECAELIQAASKYLRAQEAGKPIAQAKVALMEETADAMIISKLNRQLDRIGSESK